MGNKVNRGHGEDSRPDEGTRKPTTNQDGVGGGSTELRQEYALFISHSWKYHQEYARLVRLLEESEDFDFKNYSVPEDESFDTNDENELRQMLRERQIKPASAVVVLAGVYSTHSRWIREEMKMAKNLGKPIIGVEPWGRDRTSAVVEDYADQIVGWNRKPVIRAVRELSQ